MLKTCVDQRPVVLQSREPHTRNAGGDVETWLSQQVPLLWERITVQLKKLFGCCDSPSKCAETILTRRAQLHSEMWETCDTYEHLHARHLHRRDLGPSFPPFSTEFAVVLFFQFQRLPLQL